MADNSLVDTYLATLPPEQREALQRLRAQIAGIVPEAVETISYSMPAFKLHGRFLVSFAGWKQHCSIYPLTDRFLQAHANELTGFARSSLAFRTVWLASWLVVSLPVARALLTSPSARFVRVFPVS